MSASRLAAILLVFVTSQSARGSALQNPPCATPASSPFGHPAVTGEPVLRYDRATPDDLRALADYRLKRGAELLERLLAVTGPRTIDNTLRVYDDLLLAFSSANGTFNTLSTLHPDAAVRAAAAEQFRRLRAFRIDLNANKGVRRALAAIGDAAKADAETRYFLKRTLDDYRDTAADRDEAVEARIRQLRTDTVSLEQQFTANLRQPSEIVFRAAELDGVPPAWLARQRRSPAGDVIVTQEIEPVLRFATNPATRDRATVYRFNRSSANHDTLTRLLKLRHELAVAMGYRTFAEYQFQSHMAGSPARVRQFLDDVRKLYEPTLRRDLAGATVLLRKELPDVTSIALRDRTYAARLFRAEGGVDPAALSEYLPYARVRDGLLQVASGLFGIEFRAVPGAPVWAPSVETYDVLEQGCRLGRVYLDTANRDGRSTTAASTRPMRDGVRGRTLSELAIVAGFRPADSNDPGLMQPMQVVTFFHEFGHVLHHLFAARRWFGTSGEAAEFDFREAPSNFFGEWGADPVVVQTFARHYQTGAPLPPELLAALQRRSEDANMFQLPIAEWQSRLSLELHSQAAADVDVDAIVRRTMAATLPFEPPAATIHPEASISQLSGYAAAYYTYLWSNVIAADLQTRFTRGRQDKMVMAEYRRTVLEGGRSAPADELVRRFLGRSFTVDAWARSVSGTAR